MGWDKKLDFDEVEQTLKKEIKGLVKEKEYCEFKKKPLGKRNALRLAYNSILYVQLWNGSRISEAIDAVLKFRQANASGKKENRRNNREIYVATKKRRSKKTDRLVIIPTLIKVHYLDGLDNKTPKQIQNGVSLFALNHYGWNTHSLRYAFFSKGAKNGIPANILAKMVRHSNVGTIAAYTRKEQADDTLKEFVP